MTQSLNQGELISWRILLDAMVPLLRLGNIPDDAPPSSEWRVDYVAALTLLRSIWHVLNRVDAKQFPLVRERLELIKPRISKSENLKWLRSNRDKALKEYALSAEVVKSWEAGVPHAIDDAEATIEVYQVYIADSGELAVTRLWKIHEEWGLFLSEILHGPESVKWP